MTTSITLRNTKGSPLTYNEVDANFTNLAATADAATISVSSKSEAVALGVAADAADMGTFTGSTIPDNSDAKEAIQALETAVETKANASALGVAATAADMGTFTGSTIPDASDAKEAIQALETAVETKANASALGVAATAADMGTFTGSTIPYGQTAKQSLQALETAVELRATIAAIADNAGVDSGDGLIGSDDGSSGSLWTTIKGFISYLRSSVGSSIVGFIQSGAGAVLRTAQDKMRDIVNVKDFGAVGDGSTDDTAAINAAITAVSSAGGTVLLGAATYRVTGTIIQKNGVTLCGYGPRATILNFANGTLDCITATGSAGNYLYGIFIRDLQMTFSGKTGGRAVFWTYVANSALDNVEINGSYTGIDIYIANTVSLNRVRIVTVTSSYALRWRAPTDGSARSDVLNLSDVVLNPGWGAVDGIVWSGLAQTMNMCNVAVLQARYGLAIKATPASFPNVPAFLEAINFQVEGASQQSVRIECGSQYHFFDCGLLNRYGTTGQGSADDYAVAIYGDVADSITNGIKFIGCHIGDCAKSTIYTEARGVIVSACSLVNGGRLAANTYPAVQVAAVAQDTDICDCRDYTWGALNNYKHMIQLDNGSIRNRVQGNFSVSPGTGLILNNSIAGDNQIEGNWTNKSGYTSADGFNGVPQADGNAVGHSITAANFLAPILLRSGPAANFSDTTPTAAQIVAAIANPSATSCIRLLIANTTAFQMTILAGTGVTFGGNVSGGNFVLPAKTTRSFMLRIVNSLAGSESVNLLG
ncbi:MAG: hypothetical protein KGM99_12510 [Burkholderiales bacterium]|nr:hypothetical protein [Burkholderiales bacterium]